MRVSTPDDLPWLLAHLRAHEQTSMFAIVNLLGQGVAMRVWVADTGMIGLTDGGMVLPQWPQGDWAAAARALAGEQVSGLLGPADQVAGLLVALGLGASPAQHASDEPGFRLALRDLILPDCAGWSLHPITDAVAPTVQDWRCAYLQEVFAVPKSEARDKALRDVALWRAAGSHRVLWQGQTPAALTGFNAALPDVVQVGAVYVPPDQRNRGHARRAVGLHLAEARARGVQRAVLFAASDAAERAYAALGFQAAGRMGLVLFDAARRVG